MAAPVTMPAIFVGHGNPMNALQMNAWTTAWRSMGQSMPRPRAVLAVSAHWYLRGTRVTAMERPETIHDFGGFPAELFRVRYPAPGDPLLAARVGRLLAPVPVTQATDWGLDHGTWSVLVHLLPDASVPVLQLSIDRTQPPAFHHQLGQRLLALREEGVLVMGSGNVVHNLEAYAWGAHPVTPYDWAVRFEQGVRERVTAGDHGPLIDYPTLGNDALLSVPTPEHYLPLLYLLGLQRKEDPVTFPVTGVDGGSISMLSVRVG
jgi:4,5-DOPA dioxygenase extradiol